MRQPAEYPLFRLSLRRLNLLSPQRLGVKTPRMLGRLHLDVKKSANTHFIRSHCSGHGGCGKVYRYTTNPDIATGDGIAMAYRAGVKSPTWNFSSSIDKPVSPEAKRFLISEAVRGEGAILKRIDGERLCRVIIIRRSLRHATLSPGHRRGNEKKGDDYVLLDISHKGRIS